MEKQLKIIKLNLTEENWENLRLLAEHTEKREQRSFGMAHYCVKNGHVYGSGPSGHNHVCGTVKCVLGDAPALRFTHKQFDINPSLGPLGDIGGKETWAEYSKRLFGVNRDIWNRENHDTDRAWEFLFSGSWCHIDNTPGGAAKRLRFFLEHKGYPCNFALNEDTVKLYENY